MPRVANHVDVQRFLAEGGQVVEVLPAEEYEREHIKGAINIPLKTLDRQSTAKLDRNRPVVVYCWDHQ